MILMQHYLKVYKALLKINLVRIMTYRANFISSIFISVGWSIFSVTSILLLTHNAKTVYGWTRVELLTLTFVYNIYTGIFNALFGVNFERFSRIIDKGELDGLLLKPIDSQFLVSFWITGYNRLIRIIIGLVLTFYMVVFYFHFPITVVNIISFFVLLALGILTSYSFWFIICTIMMWSPRLSNLVELLYNIQTIARYPQTMLRETFYFLFFFFLPLTLIVSTPTKVLINKALGGDLVGLLFFTFVLFLISRWWWKFALRWYTSASG